MLDLRIVSVDYYMSSPTHGFDVTYSSFRLANVKQVPIIRVFGITPTGVKACIHIHGVFPYIYVPYDGCDNAYSLMVKIAQDLDKGINMASLGQENTSTRQHVFKITLVSGIPFYGYHAKSHQFFKIYFYNPNSVKKAVSLLEDGSICSMKFQPHEAHIPFVLQFFIDYNLYGMSFMNLSSFKVRPEACIPSSELRETQKLRRMSYCELEGDSIADSILNKISPGEREGVTNPGLSSIWNEEKVRRHKEGKDMDSMIQQTQTVHNSQPTESDLNFRQQLCQAVLARMESAVEETSQIGYAAETPEFVNLQNASFRDNHNITDIPQQYPVSEYQSSSEIFNAEDLQLIKIVEDVMGVHESDDEADQDSILGSQMIPEENINENELNEGPEEDLTVPFSPSSSCSIFEHELPDPEPSCLDSEIYEKIWSPWEESYWSGCANLTEVVESAVTANDEGGEKHSQPDNSKSHDNCVNEKKTNLDFVDGTFDSSSSDNDDVQPSALLTPPKKIIKQSDEADKRYQPLNISLQRSPGADTIITPPKKCITTPTKYSPRSRKGLDNSDVSILMKELQKNASQINEKLRSPKSSQSSSGLSNLNTSSISDNSAEGLNLCKGNCTVKDRSSKSDVNVEENYADHVCTQKTLNDSGYNQELESSATCRTPSKQIKGHSASRRKHGAHTAVVRRNRSRNLRIKVLSNFTGSSEHSAAGSIQKKNEEIHRSQCDSIQFVSSGIESKHDEISERCSNHVRKTLFPKESHEGIGTDVVGSDLTPLNFQKSDTSVGLSSQVLQCTIQGSNLSDCEILPNTKFENSEANSQVSKFECSTNSQNSVNKEKHYQVINIESMEPCGSGMATVNSGGSSVDETLVCLKSVDSIPLNNQLLDRTSIDVPLCSKTISTSAFKTAVIDPSSAVIESKVLSTELKPQDMCQLPVKPPYKLISESLDLTHVDDESPNEILSFYDKTVHINDATLRKPVIRSNIYRLRALPPTTNEVLNNMLKYGLSVESGLIPFYGNPRDPGSSKEVGVDVVKLPSYRVADLEEFVGDMGIPLEQNKRTLQCNSRGNNAISGMSSRHSIVIAPVKRPPTRKDADLWKMKLKKRNEIPPQEASVKGILEMAMFGGSSDNSQLLSLTPCTPLSSQHSNAESRNKDYVSHSTPAMTTESVFSPSVTPITSLSNIPKPSFLPSIPENDENQPDSADSSHTKSSKSVVTQLDANSVICEISNATPENSGLFKMALENLQDAHSTSLHRYITLLVVEIHCQTRGELNPDPEHDAIDAIFYCVHNDVPPDSSKQTIITGVIIRSPDDEEMKRRYTSDCDVTLVTTEMELIEKIIALVREWDPDIVAGYETEMLSWGYIIQRGYVLGLNLAAEFSRINVVPFYQPEVNLARGLDVKLTGRISLNVWRLMRHEVALMSYSFENIMYHVMHTRVSKFSFKTLSLWWNHRSPHYREFVLKYYLTRVIGIFQILDQLDFVGSTSELASLFGIQFYEVLSRGSQFRVESMMIRLAKLQNFVAVSPSIRQRAEMRSPACIPLVMEPKSRFYGDPVILLDFQSLYPSMMIAYNYCFSTCLGRMEHLLQHERFEFGCTELKIPLKQLDELKDKIHISPVGVAFVSPDVRKGTISKMVEEILETRLMVKKSMKDHKNDTILQRVLHARQLGLKLIANVTYGYTSANFSGRMPSVEVADSIVSKGRETLERVIRMVNSHPAWGAKVVYGDTDSVFVHCPGRTRQEAFIIGQEIADAATKDNPKPVKLKLEKVYQPCILQTKKRYVGFMYESPDQTEPTYDAKGIETVRRDGCPAVSKILEKSLKILFKTRDVSQVKDYVCNQMSKLFTGRVNLQDVTFAKEFRGINGYKPGACVPALKLAREMLQADRRGEPRSGERVGYVVVCGPPGVPLIKLTTAPSQLIRDPSLRINPEYYILKAILPPLDRCFTLIGANVFSWYHEFPKKFHMKIGFNRLDLGIKKSTISQYFATMKCVLCGEITTTGVCSVCQNFPHLVASGLAEKINHLEYKYLSIKKLCESCCERKAGLDCVSLDCPVLFRRVQASHDLSQIDFLQDLSHEFLPELF